MVEIQSKEGKIVNIDISIINEIPYFKSQYDDKIKRATSESKEDTKPYGIIIYSELSFYTLLALGQFYVLSYDIKAQNFNYHAIDDMNDRLRCTDLRKSSKRWYYVRPDWDGYSFQAKLDRERDPTEPIWSGYNEEQRAKRRACLASGEDIVTPHPIDYSGFRGISEEMNTWLINIPPGKLLELIAESDKISAEHFKKLLQARVVCYIKECVKEDEFEGVKYNGEKDPRRLDIIRERLRIRELRTWEPPEEKAIQGIEVDFNAGKDIIDLVFEI